MDLQEIKTYLEANKDNTEVKSYIDGFTTADRVESFLNSDDGKRLLQPRLDSNFSKGHKSWEDNNLEKIKEAFYEEKYAKEHPSANPETLKLQKQLQEVQDKLDSAEKGRSKEALTTKALKLLGDKNLTKFGELIECFANGDETLTANNIDVLGRLVTEYVSSEVSEKLKAGYTPPAGAGSPDPNSMGMKLALQAQESQKQAATAKNYFE